MPGVEWVFNQYLLSERIKENILVSGLSPRPALKRLMVAYAYNGTLYRCQNKPCGHKIKRMALVI